MISNLSFGKFLKPRIIMSRFFSIFGIFLLCSVWQMSGRCLAGVKVGVAGLKPAAHLAVCENLGLDTTVISDKGVTDPNILRKFDLVIVTSIKNPSSTEQQAAWKQFVEGGGRLLLEDTAFPPKSLFPGYSGHGKCPYLTKWEVGFPSPYKT